MTCTPKSIGNVHQKHIFLERAWKLCQKKGPGGMILPGPLANKSYVVEGVLYNPMNASAQQETSANGQKIRKILRLLGGSRRYLADWTLKRRSSSILARSTDHPAHEDQAVARFQANRDWHGGNFARFGISDRSTGGTA